MSGIARSPESPGGSDDALLLGRLADAPGPQAHADTTYHAVVEVVARRARRRRTGLSALGGLAVLTLAGGGLLALTRGDATNSGVASSAGMASSPADLLATVGSGSTRAATAEAAGGGGVPAAPRSAAADLAACPPVLPTDLPAATAGDLDGRLVAAAPQARALICAYPMPAPTAAASGLATAGVAPAVLGARVVSVEGSWLSGVAGLPATSDLAAMGSFEAVPEPALERGGAGVSRPAGLFDRGWLVDPGRRRWLWGCGGQWRRVLPRCGSHGRGPTYGVRRRRSVAWVRRLRLGAPIPG